MEPDVVSVEQPTIRETEVFGLVKAVLLILNISNTTVQNSTDFTQNRYYSDNSWHLKSSKIQFFELTDVKKNNLKIQIVSLVSNFAYSCIDMIV